MTRVDWWIGVMVIVGGLLVHGLMPRYEWRAGAAENPQMLIRIDRWTGAAELGRIQAPTEPQPGVWTSFRK